MIKPEKGTVVSVAQSYLFQGLSLRNMQKALKSTFAELVLDEHSLLWLSLFLA